MPLPDDLALAVAEDFGEAALGEGLEGHDQPARLRDAIKDVALAESQALAFAEIEPIIDIGDEDLTELLRGQLGRVDGHADATMHKGCQYATTHITVGTDFVQGPRARVCPLADDGPQRESLVGAGARMVLVERMLHVVTPVEDIDARRS